MADRLAQIRARHDWALEVVAKKGAVVAEYPSMTIGFLLDELGAIESALAFDRARMLGAPTLLEVVRAVLNERDAFAEVAEAATYADEDDDELVYAWEALGEVMSA